MPTTNPPASSGKPPRRAGRAIKIALAVLGGLVVLPLVAIPIIAWSVDLGGVVRGKVLELKPEWEARIGRKIDLGPVKLKLLPGISVELRDVAIEAAPDQHGKPGDVGAPLVSLSSLRVGVAAWPLLTSLGKDVRIDYIEAERPRANIIRYADGRLSYQDVLDKLAEEPATPKKPLTPEQLAYLRGIRASRIAVAGAALHFVELSAAGAPIGVAPLAIDQLDLVATNVRLGHAFPITVDAAVLSATRNLHFQAEVGPLPDDLDLSHPEALVRSAGLRVLPLEIQPVLRFLPPPPPGSIGLARARIEADLKLETAVGGGPIKLRGSAGASGLVLQRNEGSAEPGKPSTEGLPSDVSLRVDLELDGLAGSVNARALELKVDSMSISGSADVRKLWSQPAVHSLSLASHDLLLERLVTLLPPGTLPPGVVLRGPLAIKASGSGAPEDASVEVVVDLSGATVLLTQLHKPAGTRLSLEFKGQVKPTGIEVARLGMALGALELWAHGHVRSPRDLDLALEEGHFELDPLLRLLPTVAAEVPPNVKLGGNIHLSGAVRRQGESIDASAKVAMRDANAAASAITLGGAADLVATVKLAPGSAKVAANLDVTAARIKVPGAVDKAAGVPMQLKLDVDSAGSLMTVRDARLILPGGTVEAIGSADLKAHRLDVKIPLADLDLSKLGAVLPALHGGALPTDIANSRLRFSVALDGDPAQLSTMHARVSELALTSSGPTLRGQADVLGLDEPRRISFDLDGTRVDLDRLLGTAPAHAASPSAPASSTGNDTPIVVPKFLRHLALDGKLRAESGRFQGINFDHLVAHIVMLDGKGRVETLRMGALGGTVTADGTTIDLTPAQPRFSIRAKLDKVDIGQVLALRSPEMARKLEAKGSLDLVADGAGLRWKDVAPHVAGELGVLLADGKLQTAALGPTVIGPLLSQVSALAGQVKVSNDALSLRNLGAQFAISDGKLHTQRPMKFQSAEGAVELGGAIGLDESLALTGNIALSPALLSTITGGRLVPRSPVPVDLRVGGTLSSPRLELADPGRTIASLAAMALQSKGGELLQGALKNTPLGGVAGQLGGAAGRIFGGGQAQPGPNGAPPPGPAQNVQKQAEDQLGKGLRGIFGQ